MLDKVKVEQAVKGGLAAICAWCEHYWVDSGNRPEGHSGCSKKECGGPLSHRAFPLYRGPWSPKEKYCFFCGKSAEGMVDLGGRGSMGICGEHVSILKKLLKSNGENVKIREESVPII